MTKNSIEHRLRRLEGQLTGLRGQIVSGAGCEEVIPQFLAVKGAVTAAFTVYVKEALAECSSKDGNKRDALVALLLKS